MSATVKLTVVRGGLKGKKFIFDHPIVCTLGRDPGCLLQLPDNSEFCEISRRHCVFDIDPPQMFVRDLGSRNGTFINGQNIGQWLIGGEAPDERNVARIHGRRRGPDSRGESAIPGRHCRDLFQRRGSSPL